MRPLETFGATFAVEVSSHLCLGADTVLKAAIGKSLQTLLRDGGLLQPIKQLRYALRGEHKLTPTTRKTVLRAFGPMATSLTSVLDGAPAPEELQSMSNWQCVASSWGVLSEDNLLDVIVACFVKLDELGEVATALKAAGRIQEAEPMVATRFDQTLPAWQQVCPELSLEGCPTCWSKTVAFESGRHQQCNRRLRVPGAEAEAPGLTRQPHRGLH